MSAAVTPHPAGGPGIPLQLPPAYVPVPPCGVSPEAEILDSRLKAGGPHCPEGTSRTACPR